MGARSRRSEGRRVPQASRDVLSTVVLMGLIVLLLYPPFFRGLYFTQEQLVTLLYTLALFTLWWVHKWRSGDVRFFGSVLDYFALAAALAWTLSSVVAVNPRGAIQEALKNLNYFLAYWLVAEQIRTLRTGREARVRLILGAVYLSAPGVALVGLGAAAGIITYNGAVQSGRISSTIQYPNSLASYLTAAFFVGLGLWASIEPRDLRPITSRVSRTWARVRTGAFSASLSLVFLTFIFTLSRGAWLVFPVALLLFMGLVPAGWRLRAGTSFVATLLAAGAASPFLAKGVSAQHAGYVGLSVLIAVALGVAFGYLGELYLRQSVRWKVGLAAGLAGLLAVAGIIAVGLATTRPLTLAHSTGEKDSWKTFEQGLPNLNPGEAYTLSLEVKASGDAKKPYAWRAVVYGFNEDSGATTYLANLTGKPSGDWEQKQAKITVPEELTRLTIQLGNYYAGTQVTYRDVVIQTANGKVVVRPTFTLAKVLPNAIYRRLADISLETTSSESRLVFYQDGLKMIRDFPVLGLGGRGWASAFMKYQSYGYVSREAHNHFLQTWVETGTLGLLTWLALWGALLYLGWTRLCSLHDPSRVALAAVLTGAAAVGVHSFIDFNLSLAAISLYLWSLMGIVGAERPLTEGLPVKGRSTPSVATAVPIILAVALAVFSSRLLLGYTAGARAATLMRLQNVALAKTTYQKAISYDPWTSSYRVDLGQITESTAELDRGIALDPLNPQYRMVRGALYLRQGNVKDGLAAMQQALGLEPYQQQGYQQVAEAFYRIGESLYQAGKADEARAFLEEVLGIRQQAKDRAAAIPAGVPKAYRLTENAPVLALTAGRAQALLGENQEALSTLAFAVQNKDTAQEANVWLAALYTVQKEPKKAAPYLAKVDAGGHDLKARYASVTAMLTKP